jgi:hypothetical protein
MSLSIFHFSKGKHIPMLPQPAYSPDLSLCDFWLFSKFKGLKGKHLDVIEDIFSNTTPSVGCSKRRLLEIFSAVAQALELYMCVCLCARGECFEGD